MTAGIARILKKIFVYSACVKVNADKYLVFSEKDLAEQE